MSEPRPEKPPHVREFSPRSILVGLLVALVIGASYPYMVLKFGFGPNISVVSAFFGFLALGLFSRTYNRWENNVVQTAGTTAGQIAFLLRRGVSLVNAYLKILEECQRDRNMAYHLDELLMIGSCGGEKKITRGRPAHE